MPDELGMSLHPSRIFHNGEEVPFPPPRPALGHPPPRPPPRCACSWLAWKRDARAAQTPGQQQRQEEQAQQAKIWDQLLRNPTYIPAERATQLQAAAKRLQARMVVRAERAQQGAQDADFLAAWMAPPPPRGERL